jgi:hypothetical protein
VAGAPAEAGAACHGWAAAGEPASAQGGGIKNAAGFGREGFGPVNRAASGGEAGNVHESPERLGMRMMQSGEIIQPKTAQNILMGMDLPNMDAIEA